MITAFVPCWTKLAKAASILRSQPAGKIRGLMPNARAALCTSLIWDSEVGFPGLVSKPITLALGTSSRSTPNRFAPSVLTINVTPVTLPPGRLRLETRPRSTGSAPVAKTIGMVVVAALAATAAGGERATIASTRSDTRSAANAGKRSKRASAERYLIARLRPSI